MSLTKNPIKDFFIEMARGNISGANNDGIGGHNPSVEVSEFDNSGKPNNIETIWEQGGEYTRPSVNTQLYVSSTDAGDNQVVFINGLADDGSGNWNEVGVLATLNGQNQVALSGLLIRNQQTVVLSTHSGDIYVAEQSIGGDLVGGVPQTQSKIKSKVVSERRVSADAITTIPSGKTGYIYNLQGSIGKSKDTNIFIEFASNGGDFLISPPFEVFQTTFNFLDVGNLLTEKTDIRLSAATRDITSPITAAAKLIIYNN